jgi:hypothetical protein
LDDPLETRVDIGSTTFWMQCLSLRQIKEAPAWGFLVWRNGAGAQNSHGFEQRLPRHAVQDLGAQK